MVKSLLMITVLCISVNALCSDDDGFFGANRDYKGPYKEFEPRVPGTSGIYQLGEIDRSLIAKIAAERGVQAFKQEVERHQFCKTVTCEAITESGVALTWQKPNPLVIEWTCNEKDNSDLSRHVFGSLCYIYRLHAGVEFPYNELNFSEQKHRIDFCTNLSDQEHNKFREHPFTDTVQLTTKFFDQKSLLEAISKLNS